MEKEETVIDVPLFAGTVIYLVTLRRVIKNQKVTEVLRM